MYLSYRYIISCSNFFFPTMIQFSNTAYMFFYKQERRRGFPGYTILPTFLYLKYSKIFSSSWCIWNSFKCSVLDSPLFYDCNNGYALVTQSQPTKCCTFSKPIISLSQNIHWVADVMVEQKQRKEKLLKKNGLAFRLSLLIICWRELGLTAILNINLTTTPLEDNCSRFESLPHSAPASVCGAGTHTKAQWPFVIFGRMDYSFVWDNEVETSLLLARTMNHEIGQRQQ